MAIFDSFRADFGHFRPPRPPESQAPAPNHRQIGCRFGQRSFRLMHTFQVHLTSPARDMSA